MKEFTKKWKKRIKQAIIDEGLKPVLTILQVGDNPASDRYVRNKMRDCAAVGINARLVNFSANISEEEFLDAVVTESVHCDGLIVQLPLPKHIDKEKVIELIPEGKDVDGFRKDSSFVPCTPKGIIDYLEGIGWEIDGKMVVILGRSELVGRPLAKELDARGATVVNCHSRTPQEIKDKLCETAQLVVSAVGQHGVYDARKFPNVDVIDVGINFTEDGKMVGDVVGGDEVPAYVSPVPGGVGLLTRCALLENTLEAARRRK